MRALETAVHDATYMSNLVADKLESFGNEKGGNGEDIISFADGEKETFYFGIYDVRNRIAGLLDAYLGAFDVFKTTVADVGGSSVTRTAEGDAQLLRLGAEFDAAAAQYEVEANREYPKTRAGNEAADRGLNAAEAKVRAVHEQMLPLRATTLAGLQAKARVCQWTMEVDDAGKRGEFRLVNEETTDNQFAGSIVRDLMAMSSPKKHAISIPVGPSPQNHARFIAHSAQAGVALPDLVLGGLGAWDLMEVDKLMLRIGDAIGAVEDDKPFSRDCAAHPGLSEDVPGLGNVIGALRYWAYGQHQAAMASLRTLKGLPRYEEEDRCVEVLSYAARQGTSFADLRLLIDELEADYVASRSTT